MDTPTVSLGELYSLLGEKDVRIYQLEKQINTVETLMKNMTPPEEASKDPFKRGK